MYKDNKTLVAEAITEVENSVCNLMQFDSAATIHDAILFMLTGGRENELTEEHRKGLYMAIQHFNAIQKVQLVHNIERCIVKIA